jgi:undecaprenyl-diphosphatase
MNIYHVLFYGLIQGVAEFLPISSSAHLALLPQFLKIEDPGVTFDLMMHIGTAFAVIIYFRKDLINYLGCYKSFFKLKEPCNKETYFLRHIAIATIMTFLLVLPLKNIAETSGRNPLFISLNLMVFGLFMWIADRKIDSSEKLFETKHNFLKAILIGFSQGIAVFPGVSRSGATMGTARFLGLGREEASRFSFLLSLPIIIAGALVKIPSILNGSVQFQLLDCMLGIVFSFIFGFLTIFAFMKLIKKIGLGYFTLYRFILSLFLLYFFYFSR